MMLCKKESQVKSKKKQLLVNKSQQKVNIFWLFLDFSWLKAIFFDYTWLSFLQRMMPVGWFRLACHSALSSPVDGENLKIYPSRMSWTVTDMLATVNVWTVSELKVSCGCRTNLTYVLIINCRSGSWAIWVHWLIGHYRTISVASPINSISRLFNSCAFLFLSSACGLLYWPSRLDALTHMRRYIIAAGRTLLTWYTLVWTFPSSTANIFFFCLAMWHIKPQHNLRRQSVVAMDLDSLVDTDHQAVSVIDSDPMPQVLHDQVNHLTFISEEQFTYQLF